MFTERQAIEDQIHDNKRTIRELREENTDLLKRLREIDERDMKSNSIDLLDSLTNSLSEIIDRLSELIPHVPASAIIEHIKNTYDVESMVAKNDDAQEPTKVELAAQQEKIHLAIPKQISRERSLSIIKSIFETHGDELQSKVLEEEFYNITGKRYNNFGTTMNSVMELCPYIKRIKRGLYLYEKPTNYSGFENKEYISEDEKELQFT